MQNVTEQELLELALTRLRGLLPDVYELKTVEGVEPPGGSMGRHTGDELWRLSERGSSTEILVEARSRFAPRDVERLLAWLRPTTRYLLRTPVLVVAPWLSTRSRRMLSEHNVNYLDMSGNVLFKIDRPTVYVQLAGADRDPAPAPRSAVRIRGKGINRLVRLLTDVAPPYRLTDLAQASQLSQGYVSRVLDSLDEQALVTRGRRGVVEDVDWRALLRARADAYNLLKDNHAAKFIAPTGARQVYNLLAGEEFPVTITGSYAAYALVQVAAPVQLVAYADDLQRTIDRCDLLPTEHGADVLLLRPADRSQIDRPREIEGLRHVGLSQLALDCLSGNGRLPEEGDALLEWMREQESQWRLRELPL